MNSVQYNTAIGTNIWALLIELKESLGNISFLHIY
jgi:hypothetical protein